MNRARLQGYRFRGIPALQDPFFWKAVSAIAPLRLHRCHSNSESKNLVLAYFAPEQPKVFIQRGGCLSTILRHYLALTTFARRRGAISDPAATARAVAWRLLSRKYSLGG